MIKSLKVHYRQDTKRNNHDNYFFPRNNGHFDLFATKRGKGYFHCVCQFIQGGSKIAITRSMM